MLHDNNLVSNELLILENYIYSKKCKNAIDKLFKPC